MKVLIDNGHGEFTPGKRSPDGEFCEWLFNREISHSIVAALNASGITAELLVPETEDIPLKERVSRVNAACALHGRQNVILISIHVNAAGNGSKWLNARGWSCYTSKGRTKADELATCICNEALKNFAGHHSRTDWSDGDADIEEDFYILKKTRCPAVLTENFFMDNREDLAYITSGEGKRAIIRTHVDGIISFLNDQQPK